MKGDAFCASGEISSAAAVKDKAGTMSCRLREASQQLNVKLRVIAAQLVSAVATGRSVG